MPGGHLPQYSRLPLVPGYAWAPWQSGRYYFAPNATSTSVSSALGVGTMRMIPFVIPNRVTLTRLGGEVTVIGDAGSVVRLGLYADDGTGRPGALVIDAGTIDGHSATVQEITIATPVNAGVYWAAAAVQVVTVTQPQIRIQAGWGFSGTDCITGATPAANLQVASVAMTGVTGAFPAVPSSLSASATAPPRMFVKVG